MTESQREKWEKTRAKGRAHFIWIRGVLQWGVITALFWSAFMALVMDDASYLSWLAGAIVVFPIGGYFWGVLVWKLSERKYLQAVEANHRIQHLEQQVADLKQELGRASTEEGGTGA